MCYRCLHFPAGLLHSSQSTSLLEVREGCREYAVLDNVSELLPQSSEANILRPCLQGGDAVAQLLDLRAINRLIDFLQEGACPHYDLLAMLLANLTAPQTGTDALLQVKEGATAGLYLCAPDPVELSGTYSNIQHWHGTGCCPVCMGMS